MKTVLNKCSLFRLLRAAIGIALLLQSILQKDVAISIVAAFLVFTTAANVGCCSDNGCTITIKKYKKQNEHVYEDLDDK